MAALRWLVTLLGDLLFTVMDDAERALMRAAHSAAQAEREEPLLLNPSTALTMIDGIGSIDVAGYRYGEGPGEECTDGD
jgi:hypothetical protein